MAFAGIDLGGTYVKAGLVHPEGARTSNVTRAPMPYARAGRAADAIDVPALLRMVHAVVADLVAHGASAVLVSNQMHGVVLVDDSIEPISPMYTWQADLAADRPGGSAAVVDGISDSLGDDTKRALGNELRPGLPIVTLACMAAEGALGGANATALSIGDFITSTLCGYVTDCHVSNAAASGLYDLAAGEWSHRALHAIGADGVGLPPVVSAPTVVGRADVTGQPVPVVCAIGDQQASLEGADLAVDELSANIATGCQVSRRIPHPDTSAPQLRPYLDDDYLATVTHIPAGRALNAFVRLLTGAAPDDDVSSSWDSLESEARDAAGGIRANAAVFPAARDFPGSLTGLTEQNMTPGGVFRAAMEDVADRIALAAHEVGTRGLTRIAFSGGLAFRSALMREMVCDRVGLPARVVDEDADALTGLARISACVPGI